MNKFIVFEGPDGCGKTTILNMVYNYYRERNISLVKTREPGGTGAGEAIRNLVLNGDVDISPMTEALLMASSRSQLVDELVLPSLERGHVLTDRFVISSLVYQGIGRDLGIERVKALNDFALKDLRPHLSLYFSIDYEVSLARKETRGSTDNIEKEADDFHRKIHQGYEMVYNKYREEYNMVKIDAGQSIDKVFQSVIDLLNQGGF